MFISPSDTKVYYYSLILSFTMSLGSLLKQGWTALTTPTQQSADHIGSAPSGFGSMYDQLFANNPYRKQTYNQTGWQKVLSALGIRTGYDDWLDQTSTQAAEYDAGIFSQIQQDQFNSPAAMAQRERDAGMNPDLLGIGDVASAAGPTEDANGMSPSQATEVSPFDIVSNVSSTMLDLIPAIMSFGTQIKQMRGLRLENDMKELQFGQGAVDAATKFFNEGITPEMYKEAFETNDWTNILDASKKDAQYLAETFFSDKRAQKRFNLAYGLHSRSLLAELSKYSSYDEYEKARKSLLSQRSSSFFSDDDDTMQSLLSGFLQPIEQYQQKMNEIALKYVPKVDRNTGQELDLASQQMTNQSIYESNIDPAQQATAENAANSAAQQQREIEEATNTLFSSIMESLKGQDNWWSKIAMALVGIARAQLLSGIHMQFGRTTQMQVDGETGVITETTKRNTGISF